MAELPHARTRNAARALGAVALLVIGGLHYQQYRYAFYSSIPTIGPLFLANFIVATALGLVLLARTSSRLGRGGVLLDQLASIAGIGLAVTGLVALIISEHTPLFGFMEHGYRFVIVLSIASEAAAIVMLGLFLALSRAGRRAPSRAARASRPAAPPASRSASSTSADSLTIP